MTERSESQEPLRLPDEQRRSGSIILMGLLTICRHRPSGLTE